MARGRVLVLALACDGAEVTDVCVQHVTSDS